MVLPDGLLEILSGPRLAWGPVLTLLFLLGFSPCSQFMPLGSWAELLGRTHKVLCLAALFIDPLADSPAFWFGLAAVQFAWVRTAYFVADNHHYLEGYWCIAMAIALSAADGERWLQLDATLLLGACFALAVIAKVINPEYRDGSFFTHQMLFDPRFLPIAVGAGGITPSDRGAHLAARGRLVRGESLSEALHVSDRVRAAALALTWWTVGIESVLAILFLVPGAPLETLRAGLLCLFAVTTFAMVAVPTFGHILLIMLAVSVDDVTVRAGVLMLACSLSLLSFLPTAIWKRVHAHYSHHGSRAKVDSAAVQHASVSH
jgi:hypothetical protein